MNKSQVRDRFASNLKTSEKGIQKLPLQDEPGGEARSAVLDDRESLVLAASILEELQSYSGPVLRGNLCDEQRSRVGN
jgi:hypothetical protein